MTSEAGSFAEKTIVERKPQIIARVIADNDYPPEIVAALEAYRDEIATRPIEPLTEEADDVAFWNEHQARYAGKTWRDVPWYFAETYFYRRLLQATRYFQPGPWQGRDPFAPQKRAAGSGSHRATGDGVGADRGAATGRALRTAAALVPVGQSRRPEQLHGARKRAQRAGYVQRTRQPAHRRYGCGTQAPSNPVENIAFINDNVGADSLFDLALADFLLTQGWVQHVTFYLKNQPFFVSDAMPEDIELVIQQLQKRPGSRRRNTGQPSTQGPTPYSLLPTPYPVPDHRSLLDKLSVVPPDAIRTPRRSRPRRPRHPQRRRQLPPPSRRSPLAPHHTHRRRRCATSPRPTSSCVPSKARSWSGCSRGRRRR